MFAKNALLFLIPVVFYTCPFFAAQGQEKLRQQVQAASPQKIYQTLEGAKIVAFSMDNLIKNGFEEKNLRRMIQFAEVFPEKEIVVALIRQLTWTHFIALIPIRDSLKRDFYAEMCRIEKWNYRTPFKQLIVPSIIA